MISTETFKAEIDQFLEDMDMGKVMFGLAVANDPGFYSKMASGKDFRLSTVSRVQAYMAGKRAEAAARKSA